MGLKMLKPIEWTGQAVRLLDQTKLPRERVYVDIADEKQMWDAIRRLVVRGAPAIGIAAGFGVYLGVRAHRDADVRTFMRRLGEVCDYLVTARPTAVNLAWAVRRIRNVAKEVRGHENSTSPVCHVVRDILDAMLDECLRMIEEDHAVCRAIGENGLKVLREGSAPTSRDFAGSRFGVQGSGETGGGNSWLSPSPLPSPGGRGGGAPSLLSPRGGEAIQILTHCNAGGLATAGYGTALAPVYLGAERGMKFHVYADETRPLLQGSRITAFELKENGIPVTVICDGMAASVMVGERIDAIFVGADRIAANGDTANKIGTHGLAILARHFRIPFYVAAPISTVDLETPSGAVIPIEQRDADEVTHFGREATAPEGVDVLNPAFDVTPAELIAAIVTEKGIARAPFEPALRRMVEPARPPTARGSMRDVPSEE
jgi:methylthioribose-1-phosphate isomerase